MTKSVKNREHSEAWHLLMTRWQLRWASLGAYLPYFQLGIRDYLFRLKLTVQNMPNESLFSPAEIEQKRLSRIDEMEQQAKGLTSDRSPVGDVKVAAQFNPGKLKQVLSSLNPMSRSIRNDASPEPKKSSAPVLLNELTVDELFSPEERQLRLNEKLKSLKRSFRSGHRKALAEFKRYNQITSAIAEDEMDRELRNLERDYIHVGRVREWYGEFHQLIREVIEVANTRSTKTEFNEDPTRVLQRDFLTTMSTRLVTYRRLNDVRHEVFRLGDRDCIRLLSYFKLKLQTPDEFIDSAQDISTVKQFLSSLEYQLALGKADQLRAAEASEVSAPAYQLAMVDHETRLENWLNFKQGNARDLASLKRITSGCEDWHRDVAVFEAELEVRRLENHGLSPVSEQSIVEGFVRDMMTRIDQEIETDIVFQQLLRQLISSGERPEMLNLVLEQLKLAQSKPDVASEVPRLKAEFVQKNANIVEQLAEVIPLFRQ